MISNNIDDNERKKTYEIPLLSSSKRAIIKKKKPWRRKKKENEKTYPRLICPNVYLLHKFRTETKLATTIKSNSRWKRDATRYFSRGEHHPSFNLYSCHLLVNLLFSPPPPTPPLPRWCFRPVEHETRQPVQPSIVNIQKPCVSLKRINRNECQRRKERERNRCG